MDLKAKCVCLECAEMTFSNGLCYECRKHGCETECKVLRAKVVRKWFDDLRMNDPRIRYLSGGGYVGCESYQTTRFGWTSKIEATHDGVLVKLLRGSPEECSRWIEVPESVKNLPMFDEYVRIVRKTGWV